MSDAEAASKWASSLMLSVFMSGSCACCLAAWLPGCLAAWLNGCPAACQPGNKGTRLHYAGWKGKEWRGNARQDREGRQT